MTALRNYTTDGEFNLRDLVREIAARIESPDPGDVAAALIDAIPRRHYHDALATPGLLRDFVRHVLLGVVAHPPSYGIESPGPSRFQRRWSGELGRSIEVGGGKGIWKYLGECTFDDLVAAAQLRRDIAKNNEAEADRLEHLASLVQEHGVAMVAELPTEVLNERGSA